MSIQGYRLAVDQLWWHRATKDSRWNTANSPNFTCTQGVGYMGTSFLSGKPHNIRVGKAKHWHARQACVTLHCLLKQRHMSGIKPDASHNKHHHTTN
jgi:hypothetical protein